MLPEGWRDVELRAIVRRSLHSQKGNEPVYSVTKYGGLVPSLEYFGKQVFSRDTAKYNVVAPRDLAYATIHLDEGSIGLNRTAHSLLVSPMYTVFSVDEGAAEPDYIYRLLKSPVMMSRYPSVSQGTVNRRRSISLDALSSLSILLPPLAEQRQILRVLDAADAAVATAEAVIDQTEKVKRGLVEELLTRGMPGRHSRFKMTEIGELPESWEVVTVEAIAHVIRGASPRPRADPRYYGGPVPRLMVEDVTRDGMFVTPRVDSLTHEGAKLSRPMPAGSLTIVCSGSVGVPSILAVDACIHDGFLGLREIKPTVLRDYLYFFFAARRAVFERDATHGGVFTNLTTEILRNFKIALPPSGEQEEICDHLRALQGTLASAMAARTQASRTQAALSSDLLTGKRRVSA